MSDHSGEGGLPTPPGMCSPPRMQTTPGCRPPFPECRLTPWMQTPPMQTPQDMSTSGWYASYLNAFLFCKSLRSRKSIVWAKPSNFRMHSRHHCLFLIAINNNNHEALTFLQYIEDKNTYIARTFRSEIIIIESLLTGSAMKSIMK